ncbi:cytochrome P450 [Sphaerosporella brunnea]|uniref:Cytochrome P450 n=1 Tax=Sphaerosporella brunnea TaxID=1250544 RepID=A0A5J5EZR7_9PEZI|nr:cytochrome P450 [Sphaerosporella brunnea]
MTALLLLLLGLATTAISSYLLYTPSRKRTSNAPHLPAGLRQKLQHLGGMQAYLYAGYRRHRQGAFQYRTLFGRQEVVVCSSALIRELGEAANESMSFSAWTQKTLQLDYLFPGWNGGGGGGVAVAVNIPSFSMRVTHRWIRRTLVKELAASFAGLWRDVVAGFGPGRLELAGEIPPVYALARKCLIPAIARYSVPAPLCEDAQFLATLDELVYQIGTAGVVVGLFPEALKPWVVRYALSIQKSKQVVWEKLGRLAEEITPSSDATDHFSFGLGLIQRSNQDNWTVDQLISNTCIQLFAAFHTTATTLTMVLLELAVRPEYQHILREEAAGISPTLDAMDSLWKLDSFIRETRRFRPHVEIILRRLVIKETTLSDGTVLTSGLNVAAAYGPRERDPRYYSAPDEFDGLRFYKLRMAALEGGASGGGGGFMATSTDGTEYLGFGAGKHECPGRFFAVATIKAVVVHLLSQYELLPGSEPMQMTMRFEEQQLPSNKDRVIFKPLR